jgi:hypothetical protein
MPEMVLTTTTEAAELLVCREPTVRESGISRTVRTRLIANAGNNLRPATSLCARSLPHLRLGNCAALAQGRRFSAWRAIATPLLNGGIPHPGAIVPPHVLEEAA